MNLNILIAETKDFSLEAKSMMQVLGNVDMLDIQQADLKKALEAYDVFWFRLGFPITAADLPENPRCRFIVCPVTGPDHIDEASCNLKGISLLSLRGESEFLRTVRATAELTLGLTLALLRKIPSAVAHVQAGGWNRDLFQGQELFGKTVGIAGMGRLGKITAQYFQTFGCRVRGYDPIPFAEPGVERCDSLENLVAGADVVSLHINYTKENHHLFDDALLSKFKKGAVLINTARGGLVDSTALIEHLKTGQLSAAALDVMEEEHSFRESPLLAYAQGRSNLLITPHIGGNTRESFAKTEIFMARKLINQLTPDVV